MVGNGFNGVVYRVYIYIYIYTMLQRIVMRSSDDGDSVNA